MRRQNFEHFNRFMHANIFELNASKLSKDNLIIRKIALKDVIIVN